MNYMYKINYKQSGLNHWSTIILYVVLVILLSLKSMTYHDASWNNGYYEGTYIAYLGGDARSYIPPMENYIQTGEYYLNSPDETNIGRGPYYAVYYYVFRQFLDIAGTYDAMAILQILWFAVSIIILMKLVEMYIQYKALIWLIPIIILIIPLELYYVAQILPEAIVLSELICFAYFYASFNRSNNFWMLGWSALFLSMAAVIKPYLLPIFALCFFDWVFTHKIVQCKRWLIFIGVMSLPLVVICLPFTIRNAKKYHIFAPMQNTTFAGSRPDSTMNALRSLVNTWGEDYVSWETYTLGTFFIREDPNIDYEETFPDVMTDDYSYNDLYQLREDYAVYKMSTGYVKDSIGKSICERVELYKQSYKEAHPLWRGYAFLRTAHRLVFGHITFEINHRHSGIRCVLSNGLIWLNKGLYLLMLVLGIVGLGLCVMYAKDMRIITWIVLWLILFFSYINAGEHRFFLVGEYYCLAGMIYALDKIIMKLMK